MLFLSGGVSSSSRYLGLFYSGIPWAFHLTVYQRNAACMFILNLQFFSIDPDLRDAVYCTAIAEGGSEEWNFAYNQFKIAKVVSEKVTIMQALACTKSTWLLSRYASLMFHL